MNTQIPKLKPRLNTSIESIISSPKKVFDVIDSSQAPLAITFPEQAAAQAKQFQSLFKELSLDARIFAAYKATNHASVVQQLRNLTNIDVASIYELKSALTLGYREDQIVASGPKPEYFLEALIEHRVTIAIDSTSELERLLKLLSTSQHVKVLLRLSRSLLNMPSIDRQSRFGLDASGYDKAVEAIKHDDRLTLVGLSFHLDTQSLDERHYAVNAALTRLLYLQQRGFAAHVLDIGGGFGTDYGIDAASLSNYESALKDAISGNRPAFTWQGYPYNLRSNGDNVEGLIRGIDLQSSNPAGRLKTILTRSDATGQTLAQLLKDNLIELWIEPGASLFSNSSILVTKVIEVKENDGDTLIVVDAHRNQLCFNDTEAPLDPILVSQHPSITAEPTDAFIMGHLCVESDLLSYRKIHFDATPQADDLLLWTDTGAYRSGFNASTAIGHPLPIELVYQMNNTYTLESFNHDL